MFVFLDLIVLTELLDDFLIDVAQSGDHSTERGVIQKFDHFLDFFGGVSNYEKSIMALYSNLAAIDKSLKKKRIWRFFIYEREMLKRR